jgi:release factor glutamine methyltransferase
LAILQVNVRPAARNRQSLRSQWREKGQVIVHRVNKTALIQSISSSLAKPFAEDRLSSQRPQFSKQTPTPWENKQQPLVQSPDQESAPLTLGSHQITWTLTPATPVGRALVSAVQRLQEAGCENGSLDAQVLLAHVLGQERSWLFAHHDYLLTESEAEQFTELVARRSRYEPVAYLIGRKDFYGLEFCVDERVLIPRPETELLVDMVLAQIRSRKNRQQVVVADVGTGSGAIAVTVAIHAPEARVFGLDVSPAALAVAQHNGERLAQENSVNFLQSDLLEALPEPVDLIVANLPYVTDEEYLTLMPDVREYEPRLALQAGVQGLDVIERLLQQVHKHLKPDGAVLLEIGSHQGDAVARLAKAMKPRPSYVGLSRDYSGHVRIATLEF